MIKKKKKKNWNKAQKKPIFTFEFLPSDLLRRSLSGLQQEDLL